MTDQDMFEYTHDNLEKITAIGGHYRFTDEKILKIDDKKIFYLKGYAIFDTTCCGAGGCSYALVKGIIKEFKYKKNSKNYFVSKLIKIQENPLKDKIIYSIKLSDFVQQVNF